MAVSTWCKFKLLLWKNWLCERNNKKWRILQLLVPIFVCIILLAIRALVVTQKKLPTSYPSFSPINEFAYEMEFAFSPENLLTYQIMSKAHKRLGLHKKPIGFDNETALQNYFAYKLNGIGIIFEDRLNNIDDYPKELKYTLRHPSIQRRSGRLWPTDAFFPEIKFNRSRENWASDGGFPYYYEEHFLGIQHAVAMAFIELAPGTNFTTEKVPDIYMQRYPYPGYVEDSFSENMIDVIPISILLCFVSAFAVLVKQITDDRRHQLKEFMQIMGFNNWLHWPVWFIKSMIFFAIITIFLFIPFKVPLETAMAIFHYSNWLTLLLFLIVYSIATTTFTIMVAVFFSKANTALGIAIFVAAFIPFYIVGGNITAAGLASKVISSFLSNTAMGLGIKLILKLEIAGEGLQWKNMWTPVSIDDDFPIGIILLIMFFDSILYMSIALCIDRFFPLKNGVQRSWRFFQLHLRPSLVRIFNIFPFMKMFLDGVLLEDRKIEYDVELKSRDINVSIETDLLTKVYRKRKVAVNELKMNIYENQITVILGKKEAGKTTTMSMLAGLFPPTNGTVVINGRNIWTDTEEAPASLGICMQQNVIFNDLTVTEHLKLYCDLKGLPENQTQLDIQEYLGSLNLKNKKNCLPSELSNSMKRKLCVAIALCGRSKVILLDAPTSGMDSEARRAFWNLLQKQKQGRTIVVSTDLIDESAVLSDCIDRIAILSHGNLQTYEPSSLFKSKLLSYHLICEKQTETETENVTGLLQEHIPDIAFESENDSKLVYTVPGDSLSVFGNMLEKLENMSENLHIGRYFLCPTTLEEVFLRFDPEMYMNSRNRINSYNLSNEDSEDSSLLGASNSVEGIKLHVAQWLAMFKKKYYYTIRNWKMLLIHTAIPIGILFLTLILLPSETTLKTPPALTFNLSSYGSTVTILESSSNALGIPFDARFQKEYEKMFATFDPKSKLHVIQKDFKDYILKLGETKQPTINKMYMIAASINEENITAWFNNQAYHTAPLSLNMIHNALARKIINPASSIEVTNKPLPNKHLEKHLKRESRNGFVISLMLGFGMCFLSTYFALFIIKERVCKSKLLQLVSGASPFTFWTSAFVSDFIVFFGTVTIILAIIFVLPFLRILNILHVSCRIYLVLILFAYSVIPVTYILSLLLNDSTTGHGLIALIYIILGPTVFAIVRILDMKLMEDNNTFAWIFRIIPQYTMANALSNMYIMSVREKFCLNRENTNMSSNKTDSKCETDYFMIEKPGIGGDLIFLAVGGIFFMAVLLMIEYGIFNQLVCEITKLYRKIICANDDRDVPAVYDNKEFNFVLKDVAASRISIEVGKSECLGLIGINGAGKTSLLKILTGDEKISSGNIYIQNMDLKKKLRQIYPHIGYCPQIDAFIEDLTGKETIEIFCLLRGVPSKNINAVGKELASDLGFWEHLNKKISEYSAATKRKLSTALALIGNPGIIYLDEPTSGMNYKSRRQLWDVVCKVRNSDDRTIVVASNSEIECKALCTRLGIMEDGKFIEHDLKTQSSKDLILYIKIQKFDGKEIAENSKNKQKDIREKEREAIENIEGFVIENILGAILKNKNNERLIFYVPETETPVRLSTIFRIMENNKDELGIAHYSLCHKTLLEQAFSDLREK